MFMVSFRVRRMPVIIFCAIVAVAVLWGMVGSGSFGLAQADSSVIAGSGLGGVRGNLSAKTEDDRLAFLAAYGWEVVAEPLEVLEVVIPKEFDEVYEAYNEIQKEQGFNLSGYAGKRSKRYVYRVLNYPGTEEPVRACLLVYRNKIIGGDVASEVGGSFLHGFELK